MRYTLLQKEFCVEKLLVNVPSREVCLQYREKFPAPCPCPSQGTIIKWKKKFQETGSLEDKKRSGRPPIGDEAVERVKVLYQDNDELSVRKGASSLTMNPKTVHNILRKKLKLKPYKVKKLHKRKTTDETKRTDFCEQFNAVFVDDNINNLMFSDEAGFKLVGSSNRQNKRKWKKDNPEDFIEEYENKCIKLNVWASITPYAVLGPVFFDGNVDGPKYLQMLQDFLIPELENRGIKDTVFFQQDGAPAHYDIDVRQYLDQELAGRWIGRQSPTFPWPPRSPDLTPMDFFFWSYIKSKAYCPLPNNLEELKNNIRAAFATITNTMLQNTYKI